MSRPAMLLLVTVGAGRGKARFGWPVPLFLLPMLSGMAADVLDFLAFFAPRGREDAPEAPGKRKPSVRTARRWVRSADAVLREEFAVSEPWELLSVETEDALIRIKVL